ncbi:anti-sigma regulatory factor [Paracraurococcus lichenis]|uniref:Anti-sigma regulatory factor n=1 Tax=Paracraurococcus lichenis TaxID=3064888 RepID=A0ABT9E9S1_9PROT|nr:anti-sigma regulatory factor [Paracraurococcus sp. LOR1-02]MDO9712957.1 anti-sigma regulatory factor [Paracraurococcus sp. LOR1-02]
MAPAPGCGNVTVRIGGEDTLPAVRRAVDDAGRAAGFGLVDQTKLMTAASELARNIVLYAVGGVMTVEHISSPGRTGVRLIFADSGPGISDLERAMQDGYSSDKGMGLGLPGAKRLAHEFSIASSPATGTRVVFVLWRR